MTTQGNVTDARPDKRDPACVARWPECGYFLYDPRCCRFPKSCSPTPPAPAAPPVEDGGGAVERRMKISGPDQYGYYRTSCPCGWAGGPWQVRRDSVREWDAHECIAPAPAQTTEGGSRG